MWYESSFSLRSRVVETQIRALHADAGFRDHVINKKASIVRARAAEPHE